MKSSLAGQEDHVWQVAEVAARQLLFEARVACCSIMMNSKELQRPFDFWCSCCGMAGAVCFEAFLQKDGGEVC